MELQVLVSRRYVGTAPGKRIQQPDQGTREREVEEGRHIGTDTGVVTFLIP